MNTGSNENNNDSGEKKGSNFSLYLIVIGSVLLLGYLMVSQYMQNH